MIAANLARPNEKFLGYLDGGLPLGVAPPEPDRAAARGRPVHRAGRIGDDRSRGSYMTAAGEVRWAALPVDLAGTRAAG